MGYQYVVEPLSDPRNTLELLFRELQYQTIRAALPAVDNGNIDQDLGAMQEATDSQKVRLEIKNEILRRFKALQDEISDLKSQVFSLEDRVPEAH